MATIPTLPEFIAAAKPLNPGATDQDLAAYWHQEYGPSQKPSESPSVMPTLDTFIEKAKPLNPQASDADLKAYWQQEYGSKGARESEPQGSDIVRGATVAVKQIPQLAYGLEAGAGAVGEKLFGEGGISTAVKEQGLTGYAEKSRDIAATSKESDSFSTAYDQAKAGNFGALVDWLQYGLGYAGGQAVQMLATAGVGSLAGKMALQPLARLTAEKLVSREAATLAGTEAAKNLTAQEITKIATANVASRIGQTVAIGATATGMEGGEIFGDLTQQAQQEGRTPTGAELGKAFGTSLAAGALEFVGDKFGLDLMLGRSPVGKIAANIPGVTGRLARAGVSAAAAVPVEAATEYAQTLIEAAGKGQDPFSAETTREAVDSAMLGTVGGAAVGGASGAVNIPRPHAPVRLPTTQAPPPPQAEPVAPILDASTVDTAIAAAAQAVEKPAVTVEALEAAIKAQTSELPQEPRTGPPAAHSTPQAEIVQAATAQAAGVPIPGETSGTVEPVAERQIEERITPMAPVRFEGIQQGSGRIPDFPLWTALEDLPPTADYPSGVPKGSTVSSDTLIKAGFQPPPLPDQATMARLQQEKQPQQTELASQATRAKLEAMRAKPAETPSATKAAPPTTLSPAELQRLEGELATVRAEPEPPRARPSQPSSTAGVPTVPPGESPEPTAVTTRAAGPGTAIHPAVQAYIDRHPPAMQPYFTAKAQGFEPQALADFGGTPVPVLVKEWIDTNTALVQTPGRETHLLNNAPAKLLPLPGQPASTVPTFQKTAPVPVSAHPIISTPRSELPPEQNANLAERADVAAELLAQGAPGKRQFTESPNGPGQIVTGIASTYPKWYGPLRMKKETVLKALAKIQEDHGVDVGPTVEKVKAAILSDRDLDKIVGEFPGLQEELGKPEYGTPFAQIRGKNAGQTGMFGEPTEPTPAKAAPKVKAQQTALPMSVPVESGQRPIIGREATRAEAPLFSKEAQTPEPENLTLPVAARQYAVLLHGKTYPVASLAEASAKFRGAVEAAGTGASATPSPTVIDRETGKPLGYISYNGRIWEGEPQEWTPQTLLLYEAREPVKTETPFPQLAGQSNPAQLLTTAAAHKPASTVSKQGDHWRYTTIRGTDHPATYGTRKEAIEAAERHQQAKLDEISNEAFQRMLQRMHGQDVPPLRRESARLKIKKALRDLDAEVITPAQFVNRMEGLYESLELKRQEQVMAETPERLRGADIIRERMIQAVRRGELPRAQLELAEWFLKGNEHLFEDLGISVRQPIAGQSGQYRPLDRIMVLMKGTKKPDTAVHEMLHHLERLMPQDYQQAIRKEWLTQITALHEKATGDTKAYLDAVLLANASRKTEDWKAAQQYINDGNVDYSLYSFMNPSEFWAVKGSGILQARHTGIWERIKQWMREAVERIKGALGLSSDAPILQALAWLQTESTGEEVSKEMLANAKQYAEAIPTQESTIPARGIERLGALTAAQQTALQHIHGVPQTWRDRLNEFKTDWKRTLVQGIFDQYAPILGYSKKAYILARMAKGGDGTLEALLLYGKPYVDQDGAYRVDYKEESGMNGFGKVLAKLQGEEDRFLEWVAAQRAERLKGIGLEHLYRETDIAALKTLNEGTMPNGSSRPTTYALALLQLNEWNSAILKIAVDSKLIDPETAKLYKDTPYVPFYRLQEEGVVQGFGMKAGLVNQYAWKKLKGGTEHLNDDLLANLLQNWSHLITASAKNRAAKATLEAAIQAKVAHEVSSETPGKGLVGFRDDVTRHIPAGQEYEEGGVAKVSDGTAAIMMNAERVFMVDDPALLDAVAALHYAGLGSVGRPFITAKRWLTTAVTVNPAFKIRNLLRDSIQAIGTAELSYNPAKNIAQGFKATAQESETRAQLLASGGMIRFGSMLDGNNADRTRHLIEQHVDPDTILDDSGKVKRFWKQKLVPAFEAYQELGDRGEQISRAALYEQLLAKGLSHQEASFWARDLLDFSLSGKWEAVRILTQIVPFMNARLQGIYKLGRATKTDYRRMGMTLGTVALASIALLLAHQDDDDWKKREDWDRDNFWWFKVGDVAFRLPKPFEIGALGTIAERSVEYLISREMTGERFGKRISATIFSQLSMNPTPQLAKPLMDLYANKDAFTGRPIETLGMERLRKEDRYTERTSELAKFFGSLGLPDPTQLAMGQWNTLSPVQIDALVHGYFSWLGSTATTVLDYGLRPMMNRGERPNMRLRDVFLAGNFVETLPTGSSRYLTDLYDQAAEIEQAYGSYRDALKRGDQEQARSIFQQEREKIRKYSRVEAIKRSESALNAQIRRIEASRTMSGTEKRVRIDVLESRKNRIAQSLVAG